MPQWDSVEQSQHPIYILYIRPPCLALLQKFISLPVEHLSPRYSDLVPNSVVVKLSVIYSFLIDSGRRILELGEEALILGSLGMVFTCWIFPCCIWRAYIVFIASVSLYILFLYPEHHELSFPFNIFFLWQSSLSKDMSAPPLKSFCFPTFSIMAWVPLYVSTVPFDYLYYCSCYVQNGSYPFTCLQVTASHHPQISHVLVHSLSHTDVQTLKSSQGLVHIGHLISWYMEPVCISMWLYQRCRSFLKHQR